jgi:ATP-dependent DNA helicase RecG
MRPELLNPLFAETESLEGVGPKLKKPLEKLGLTRVKDVAYHLPDRFVQRRAVADLDEAGVGEQIVVPLTVFEHRASPNNRAPHRVMARDAKGNVCALVYFGKASYTAKKLFPIGEQRWVAGKLEQYDQWLQIVHPDHVAESSADLMGHLVEPVYPLAEGLTLPTLAHLAAQALDRAPELPEWIEPGVLARHKWPAWRDALILAHRGEYPAARERLAYDELLANSLALMLVRADNRKRRGQPLKGDGRLRAALSLPFPLTGA